MRALFMSAMILIGAAFVFGAGNNDKNIDGNFPENLNSPVITGAWQKIEKEELNDSILSFVDNYLENRNSSAATEQMGTTYSVKRVWTQLVQGRRYLIAYNSALQIINGDNLSADAAHYVIGLLKLRRDFDGAIALEKDYKYSELLDFIDVLLIGEDSKETNDECLEGGRQ